MRYHSEHLKLYFEKNTVLQRGDLKDKSEIKKLFLQCKYHFPQKMIHLIFDKNPTCFHNLLSMTILTVPSYLTEVQRVDQCCTILSPRTYLTTRVSITIENVDF